LRLAGVIITGHQNGQPLQFCSQVEDPELDLLSHQIVVAWNEPHCSVNPQVPTVREALTEFLRSEVAA
jgi:hypothetical protein